MTDEERNVLLQSVAAGPAGYLALVPAVIHWALTLCFSLLLMIAAWSIVAWLARTTMGLRIGWDNDMAVRWVLSLGGLACLAWSIAATARWARARTDLRQPVQADVANGRVIVEQYEFSEAVRMQEPEHLGLVYFLREADDAAFVWFDRESQDLGARGEDPLTSGFVPRSRLSIVRAPESRLAIASVFSGEALQCGDASSLTAAPRNWPEHEEIAPVRWSRLQATYSR